MITEEEALNKFNYLLEHDEEFALTWLDCEPDFYRWCSTNTETKHIKPNYQERRMW